MLDALERYQPMTIEIARLHKIRAVREFQKLDHRLSDGTQIEPTTTTSMEIVLAAQERGVLEPWAIWEKDCSRKCYHSRAEVDAERKLRAVRFAHFCQMDGHSGSQEETSSCDLCGGKGVLGTMHYAPDAMCYPAAILFDCYTCRPKVQL
jgi:hypothetical protein